MTEVEDVVKERFEDVILLALKMEGRSHKSKCAGGSWKRQGVPP